MRSLLKYNIEDLIFFDIETAPIVPELKLDTPLFNSWEYKVNKEGKMTNQEVVDSYSNQAGLYPEFAKVVSIVLGKVKGGKINLITLDSVEEADILNGFNNVLERNPNVTLAGFVNLGFDTPFIFKRMIINGIQPNSKIDNSGLKPWEVDELDLSVEWKGTSFNRASLINIATAFGLPSPKDDISGADVGKVYWGEGKKGLARISKYCRKDVVTTINIFRKMRLEEPLELSNKEAKQEEDLPLLAKLFSGAKFDADARLELESKLRAMSDKDRKNAVIVLNAMTSTAKGKETSIKKSDVKSLINSI